MPSKDLILIITLSFIQYTYRAKLNIRDAEEADLLTYPIDRANCHNFLSKLYKYILQKHTLTYCLLMVNGIFYNGRLKI